MISIDNNRQLLEKLASTVNLTLGASTVSTKRCSVIEKQLSFYFDFKFYTLFDLSYTPFVHYNLLSNGDISFLLDGSFKGWASVNCMGKLNLSTLNIIEYTRIVLETTRFLNSRIKLVTSIEDIDFNRMPEIEKLHQIESAIKPPVVSYKNNEFTVLSNAIEGSQLFDCLISVQTSGEITITDKNLILTEIPADELVLD